VIVISPLRRAMCFTSEELFCSVSSCFLKLPQDCPRRRKDREIILEISHEMPKTNQQHKSEDRVHPFRCERSRLFQTFDMSNGS
jgi:hypothetical protein